MIADQNLKNRAWKTLSKQTLKPAFKRELLTHLITSFRLSIRQACWSLNLSRTVYHYRPDTTRDEPVIVVLQAMEERYPRYSFPTLFCGERDICGITMAEWTEKHAVKLEFIQLDKPTQNAFIERYKRTYRPIFICSEHGMKCGKSRKNGCQNITVNARMNHWTIWCRRNLDNTIIWPAVQKCLELKRVYLQLCLALILFHITH